MWYIILFFATLLIDQISKIALDALLEYNVPHVLIKGTLNIRMNYNTGASFSFLHNEEWAQIFFFVLTSVVLIAGITYVCIKKPKGRWLNSTLALLFSGTIGNFIDRVSFGHVRDFIDVPFFANFNIADCCLCIGAVMLVIYVLFLDDDAVFRSKKSKEERKAKKQQEEK